jgi:HK97 family phage prohead protease
MEKERRHIEGRGVSIETRADGKKTMTGYAAVFYRSDDPGTQYQLWHKCQERIDPKAYNRALAEKQDVLAVFNHDDNKILGRTSSGTCRLSVDKIGLKYEIDLPEVTDPANLRELVQRGDISGSSFSFRATGVAWTKEGDQEIRTITDCDLYDVGPVGRPAYAATSTGVRQENAEALKRELADHKKTADDIAIRLRLLDISEPV